METEIMNIVKQKISICWLRRDLRLNDNAALYHALQSSYPVLLLFIYDTDILSRLPDKKDKRVAFIHKTLENLNLELIENNSSLFVLNGAPLKAFEGIIKKFNIQEVFVNHDYEPSSIERDLKIKEFLGSKNISFHSCKDQVIFEKSEIVKPDGHPYTIFTPYSKTWMKRFREEEIKSFSSENYLHNLVKVTPLTLLSLQEIGFENVESYSLMNITKNLIQHYHETRNIPSLAGTSHSGIHLRFGTISIRHLLSLAFSFNEKWLNELIWREFFMMILFHFPHVVNNNFRTKYDEVQWRNNEYEFEKWCKGETGFPMVDAGMRELNESGWMHNRVRMITAGFLCKHLLIDWRWGEVYFAEKLLDYELSSNNGNWQWAAGTGCDAAPYFRIFNPSAQIQKFDPQLIYIKKWIKNFRPGYLPEIVKHEYARKRAIMAYKGITDGN